VKVHFLEVFVSIAATTWPCQRAVLQANRHRELMRCIVVYLNREWDRHELAALSLGSSCSSEEGKCQSEMSSFG